MKRLDFEPMIWFVLSATFILGGYFLFESGNSAWATLASALGGAGIARVRSSRPGHDPPPSQQDRQDFL